MGGRMIYVIKCQIQGGHMVMYPSEKNNSNFNNENNNINFYEIENNDD